jgi:hypothetical protein
MPLQCWPPGFPAAPVISATEAASPARLTTRPPVARTPQNEVETYFISQKYLSIIHFPQYWLNMQAKSFALFRWMDGYQETSWVNTATTSPGWGWGTNTAGKKEPDASSDLCVVADWFERAKAGNYSIWSWNNIACTLKRAYICKYQPPREWGRAGGGPITGARLQQLVQPASQSSIQPASRFLGD